LDADYPRKWVNIARRFTKNRFETLDEIIADGKVHNFDVDGYSCQYILIKDKPAVGLYKRTDSDTVFRWALKRKGMSEENVFNERIIAMEQLLKEAGSRSNKKKSEISLDEMNQMEACQTDKILDDIAVQTVERLACISPFYYDRIRKEEARQLNIRMCTLDNAVKKARKLYTSAKSTPTEPEQPDLDY